MAMVERSRRPCVDLLVTKLNLQTGDNAAFCRFRPAGAARASSSWFWRDYFRGVEPLLWVFLADPH